MYQPLGGVAGGGKRERVGKCRRNKQEGEAVGETRTIRIKASHDPYKYLCKFVYWYMYM